MNLSAACINKNASVNIIFDPYWPKWQTKCSKLADKDFETFEFHQDT